MVVAFFCTTEYLYICSVVNDSSVVHNILYIESDSKEEEGKKPKQMKQPEVKKKHTQPEIVSRNGSAFHNL